MNSSKKPPNLARASDKPEPGFLNVSVPSASGHYIDLEKQGKLEQLLKLQNKREQLQQELMITNAQLSKFENRLWLLQFYVGVRNRGGNFQSALNRAAQRLERRKEKWGTELAEIEEQISRIDPLILRIPIPAISDISSSTQMWEIPDKRDQYVFLRDHEIKRLAKKGLSASKICGQLDLAFAAVDRPPLGIPDKWVQEFGQEWKKKYEWKFYRAAYNDARTKNRMQKMISKAKKRLS